MMTFYDPVVKRRLRHAITALLHDRHGHLTPGDLIGCEPCAQRLWTHLEQVTPEAHRPQAPDLHPEQL